MVPSPTQGAQTDQPGELGRRSTRIATMDGGRTDDSGGEMVAAADRLRSVVEREGRKQRDGGGSIGDAGGTAGKEPKLQRVLGGARVVGAGGRVRSGDDAIVGARSDGVGGPDGVGDRVVRGRPVGGRIRDGVDRGPGRPAETDGSLRSGADASVRLGAVGVVAAGTGAVAALRGDVPRWGVRDAVRGGLHHGGAESGGERPDHRGERAVARDVRGWLRAGADAGRIDVGAVRTGERRWDQRGVVRGVGAVARVRAVAAGDGGAPARNAPGAGSAGCLSGRGSCGGTRCSGR